MKIVSRYILNEFMRIFVLTLVGFILVFLTSIFWSASTISWKCRLPLLRVGYFFLISCRAWFSR
jgi:lipopolysaccharide export LptBFGC system permease protein LptF